MPVATPPLPTISRISAAGVLMLAVVGVVPGPTAADDHDDPALRAIRISRPPIPHDPPGGPLPGRARGCKTPQ